MNMASIGVALLIFTVICISVKIAAEEFVKVQCKTEYVGQYGQKSMLECVVKTAEVAGAVQIRYVIWKKDGVDEALLTFGNEKLESLQGYLFAEPSWNNKNMNVSLLISDTALQHEGGYECEVITDSGSHSNRTSLKVTARYTKPTINSIPETITHNTDGTLVCKSDGGYPEGQLRWFDEDGYDWTKSAEMEARPTGGGLFQLSSKLRQSAPSKYTCVVFNASGGREDETTFEIQDRGKPEGREQENNSVTKIVAPMVVIGSLIVGLLLALAWRCYRKRTPQARRPSATPLVGGHRGVGISDSDIEEGELRDMDRESQDSNA